MFTDEQLAKARKDQIVKLVSDPEATWFVDANVVISGAAASLLGWRMLTTPDVVVEVRKRPKSRAANQLIDRLEASGSIITLDSFADAGRGFELLTECAKMLAPGVQFGKNYLVQTQGLTERDAEVRALEGLSNEGSVFRCDMLNDAVERGYIPPQSAVDRGSFRSWHQYPTKRRKKPKAEYRFSDEILLSTALAYSLLRRQNTCVLSDDTDCAAIMKQLTDNLLWAVTEADFRYRKTEPDLDEFNGRWMEWCRYVDHHRQGIGAKRIIKAVEAEDDQELPWVFAPNEMLVCRLTNPLISSYTYPRDVVDFIRGYRGGATWPWLTRVQ